MVDKAEAWAGCRWQNGVVILSDIMKIVSLRDPGAVEIISYFSLKVVVPATTFFFSRLAYCDPRILLESLYYRLSDHMRGSQ